MVLEQLDQNLNIFGEKHNTELNVQEGVKKKLLHNKGNYK